MLAGERHAGDENDEKAAIANPRLTSENVAKSQAPASVNALSMLTRMALNLPKPCSRLAKWLSPTN